MEVSTKVAACLACHFTDARAAGAFFAITLPSVLKQERMPDKIFVSWSASECCAEFCRSNWAGVRNTVKDGLLVVLYSTSQLFQFQHYEKINASLKDMVVAHPEERWYLVFGDSDDVWQEVRVMYMLARAEMSLETHSVFVFNWKMCEDGIVVRTTDHLDQFEYWMCMTHVDVLDALFSSLPNSHYLANHWTDLAFDTFLLTYGGRVMYFKKQDADPWLYRYSGCNSVRHRGFTVTSDRLNAHMKRRLMELYPNPIVDNDTFQDNLCTVHVHRPITIVDVLDVESGKLQQSDIFTIMQERDEVRELMNLLRSAQEEVGGECVVN